MNKSLKVLLFLPLFLVSCNRNDLTIAKSPFSDDNYNRIGIKAKYIGKLDPIDTETYNDLINTCKNYTSDEDVYHYTTQEETRDLIHSYFGNEYLTYCTLSSIKSEHSRFDDDTESETDRVGSNALETIIEKRENQTSSNTILKADSKTDRYTYDAHYRWETTPEPSETDPGVETKYGVREKVVIDSGVPEVTQAEPEKEMPSDSNPFALAPYKTITGLFSDGFGVFKENNKAVYGQYGDNKNQFLIREAHTVYEQFTTDAGKNYKAARNYFYEGLLKKCTKEDESVVYRFTNFRYYQELIILSKACYENVPVIYLEQPVLVSFKEVEYNIEYNKLPACNPDTYIIPALTK